jgi:DNA repair photolyase
MKITKSNKHKMIELIAEYERQNGGKPDSEYLAKRIPGYGRQQYAAVIAHVTMGSYQGSGSARAIKSKPNEENYRKITEKHKIKLIGLIAEYERQNGKKPDSDYLAQQVPGYSRQQYAAVIAHVTMGTFPTKASGSARTVGRKPTEKKHSGNQIITCPSCGTEIHIEVRTVDKQQAQNHFNGELTEPPIASSDEHTAGQSSVDQIGLDLIRTMPGKTKVGKPVIEPVTKRAKREGWRIERIAADVLGLTRPLEVFRASRKTGIIKPWDPEEEQRDYCPACWVDLAIGSGACGFRCRACFLIYTHRTLCDPSRHLLYDNVDDYEKEVKEWLLKPDGKYKTMGLGIDCSDSLLYEGITGHARRLIPLFASKHSNPNKKRLILLTKSSNVRYLKNLPTENIILTYSLNPEPIANLWEGKFDDGVRVTPPMAKRLEDSKWGKEMGFQIRWRIDPILPVDGWMEMYADFFADAAKQGHRPERITLGTYREMSSGLETFSRMWGFPPIEWQKPKLEKDGKHYHVPDRFGIYSRMCDIIKKSWKGTGFLPEIGLCKESRSVHQQVGTIFGNCNCQ